MADISQIKLPDNTIYDIKDPIARSCIAFGQVDSTSTATAFTAQIEGITSYYDGLAIMLKNGVVTSAEGFTININGLGAKGVYNNMTPSARETTIFNINYTMLFVYDSTRVSGGGWICYRGYAVAVGEPLVVTITLNPSATTTNTMFSADKTYTEISAAVEEGIPCVAIYSGKVYPFSGWYGSSLNFTYEYFTHSATNGRKVLMWQTIRINSSNVVSGLGYYNGEQKTQSPQSTYLTVNLPVSAGTQGQMLVADATGTGLSWQNQPTIPTVPTDVSAFTNDAGYLTLATLPIYDGTVV